MSIIDDIDRVLADTRVTQLDAMLDIVFDGGPESDTEPWWGFTSYVHNEDTCGEAYENCAQSRFNLFLDSHDRISYHISDSLGMYLSGEIDKQEALDRFTAYANHYGDTTDYPRWAPLSSGKIFQWQIAAEYCRYLIEAIDRGETLMNMEGWVFLYLNPDFAG